MIVFMSNCKTLDNILDADVTVIKIINNGFNALLPKSRASDNLTNLVPVMDYHPNFRDVPKLIKDHLKIL